METSFQTTEMPYSKERAYVVLNSLFDAVLDSSDSLYRVLAQYVHGGHASTWLYRSGLGTLKQGGEFISPPAWHAPLYITWKNLQVFGESILRSLRSEAPDFRSEERRVGPA